jgi:hypothetical protein
MDCVEVKGMQNIVATLLFPLVKHQVNAFAQACYVTLQRDGRDGGSSWQSSQVVKEPLHVRVFALNRLDQKVKQGLLAIRGLCIQQLLTTLASEPTTSYVCIQAAPARMFGA